MGIRTKIKKILFVLRKINRVSSFIKKNSIKDLLNITKIIDTLNSHYRHIYEYKVPVLSNDIKKSILRFEYKPLISIIMPVYNVDKKWLELAVQSVENQWYDNWELCLADDCSTNQTTINYLKSIKNKSKIRIKFLKANLNISGASNEALSLASGEYVGFLDNDDELTPDALYEVVKCINRTGSEFIYSDEDKVGFNGRFVLPHYKPDYSYDMFLSQNYICHFTVIKKMLIDIVGGFTLGMEGAQDFDLFLRILESTDQIFHIHKILYHWRMIPSSTASEFMNKSYAQLAGRKALNATLKRRKINALTFDGKFPGTYRVKYNILNPLISIIIPFKDKYEILEICIMSILNKTCYNNYEVICVSNNSQEKETHEFIEKFRNYDSKIKFYEYNIPFNYSKINNYAVKTLAKGEHIVLLNNDTEVISEEWLESLLEFSQKPDIGAVGCLLLYPDNRIQHAGVILGIGGVADHSHNGMNSEHGGYFARPHVIKNISAVTGACMMVKKKCYNEIHGLDEVNLKIAFNDVDFCLRLIEKGYKNIYTPYAKLYHHESISRGVEVLGCNRFSSENNYMLNKYKDLLTEGDPYYNTNLTLSNKDFGFK